MERSMNFYWILTLDREFERVEFDLQIIFRVFFFIIWGFGKYILRDDT